MSLRRIAASLLVLAAACAKDVEPESTPAFVDYAVFDPSAGAIPLPNDLALLPQSVAAQPPGAQRELLEAFQLMGGFPNDLEVPITIDFVRSAPGRTGSTTSVPALDLTTITPATLVVLKVGALGATAVPYDVAGYAPGATKGTLTLRTPDVGGERLWEAGAQYVVAVRGGPSGVKTLEGGVQYPVNPQPAMYLLLQGKNLADPANQALLPDPSAGAQLELIRQSYLAPLSLVEAAFPAREIAVLQTFKIAPARTHVVLDAAAGVVPFPSNFLLDYTQDPPRVVNNPAFGPAAPGLATLDGFTTTGMLLASTSAPVSPATVKNDSVFLFRVQGGVAERVWEVGDHLASGCSPTRPATFVAQPPPLNAAPVPTIALQPAVPVALPAGLCAASLFLPPLEESSDYVVVITNRVKDASDAALGRTTPASLLLFSNPLHVGGVPTVPGLDAPTATLLEILRQQIGPALAALPAGLTKADVAFAYPIHTQSITGVSLQLSALPYGIEQGAAAAVFTPQATSVLDVTAAFGIPKGAAIDEFHSVTTTSLDAIDVTTGALRPDLATLTPAQMAALVKPLSALVAIPFASNANIPACPPPNEALKCAKLVIFEHGLGGGHLQMIAVANSLAEKGFVAAAIDFPLHGDRAYCTTAADCNSGGTCDLIPGAEGQGDTNPPGICSNGNQLGTNLTSVASGRYFISANFFRTRDAIRQNLLDQSALALSLARPPAPLAPQPAANPFASALLAKGIAVDPSAVYFEGISLGGIAGTEVLATNPRVTRGALSVPGGTLTDVFTNAPAFASQVDALFLSLGIDRSQIPTDPAVAAAYLRTVNLVKWIVDPADPINFAKHVSTRPLPNLLSPTPALQSPKSAWGQLAVGDTVVPNPFNQLLFANGAIPFTAYTSNGGNAPHSMLASSATAQTHAAGWLFDLTNPGAAVDLTDVP